MHTKPETTNPIIASQICFIHGDTRSKKDSPFIATPRFARPQPFERHEPCSIQTKKQQK